jgi:hypothetical protein
LGFGASAQPHGSDDAASHWVVTTDGERIETRGPWRIDGRRVLFVAANGSLVSIRVDQVDLEASREASAPERAGEDADTPKKPLPPRADPPKARLVLTEEDLPPMTNPAPATAEPAAEGAGAAAAGAAAGLTVLEWRNAAADGEPLQIFGTVRNDGPRPNDSVSVVVTVFDEAGNQLASQAAVLQTTSLQANQSTGFRVAFPDVTEFERVEIVPSPGNRP